MVLVEKVEKYGEIYWQVLLPIPNKEGEKFFEKEDDMGWEWCRFKENYEGALDMWWGDELPDETHY